MVLIQNQKGTSIQAKRWDRSGVALEVSKFDKYVVRVEGTDRIKMRNRRFLRKAEPYQSRQPGPGPEIVKSTRATQSSSSQRNGAGEGGKEGRYYTPCT